MTNHRSGAVTFKGNPLTLVGDELAPGAKAPNFDLHCYGPDGMQHVKRDDFLGKPLIVSVVPSGLTSSITRSPTKECSILTTTSTEETVSAVAGTSMLMQAMVSVVPS